MSEDILPITNVFPQPRKLCEGIEKKYVKIQTGGGHYHWMRWYRFDPCPGRRLGKSEPQSEGLAHENVHQHFTSVKIEVCKCISPVVSIRRVNAYSLVQFPLTSAVWSSWTLMEPDRSVSTCVSKNSAHIFYDRIERTEVNQPQSCWSAAAPLRAEAGRVCCWWVWWEYREYLLIVLVSDRRAWTFTRR